MEDMTGIVERLQRVEEDLRRVKRSRVIWLSLAAGLLLVAFQAPSPNPKDSKVVEAEGFRLVDEQGRLRGEWTTNRVDAFTRFSIWDYEGMGCDEVVRIQSYAGGGEIMLQGDKDHGKVSLSTEDRGGHLRLHTARVIPKGGILYEPVAEVDALADHGRIELSDAQFEEPPEGGLTVHKNSMFYAPDRK